MSQRAEFEVPVDPTPVNQEPSPRTRLVGSNVRRGGEPGRGGLGIDGEGAEGRSRVGRVLRSVSGRVTSLPALVVMLLGVTVLAIGPLQGLDRSLNRPWTDWVLPEAGPVLAKIIDPLASQKVMVPVLGLVALWLAWRRWTVRPLVSGAIAELGVVCLGGAMKVLFARASPKLFDPAFFEAGLLEHGWRGISFPSGHAMEAVTLYGTLAFLVFRYGSGSKRTPRLLAALACFVTAITVAQSMYMGWHWMTDLVAGLLVGFLMLRAVSGLDTAMRNKPYVNAWPLDYLAARLPANELVRKLRAPQPALEENRAGSRLGEWAVPAATAPEDGTARVAGTPNERALRVVRGYQYRTSGTPQASANPDSVARTAPRATEAFSTRSHDPKRRATS